MNIFKRIKAAVRYRKAVKMADKAYRKTGVRKYVLPLDDKKKTLLVLDRYNMRIYKRKGYMSQKVSVLALEKECFYCTPYANGTGLLPKSVVDLKKKQYLAWFAS
jgi:hypothetical protein